MGEAAAAPLATATNPSRVRSPSIPCQDGRYQPSALSHPTLTAHRCVVETNCRARWANWKQFFTNGAQSMLNQALPVSKDGTESKAVSKVATS